MELVVVFKWIIMCFMVSCFMRPFLHIKNLKLLDEGFSLSLVLGIVVSFIMSWFVAAVTPMKYDRTSSYGAVIVIAIAAVFVTALNLRRRLNENNRAFGIENIRFVLQQDDYLTKTENFLKGFFVFFLLFLVAVWIKGFSAAITPDTEKYMDFAFLQSIFRQKSAVPEDVWFCNEKLNYYYLGHSITVHLINLALITPEYGYNLMICFIASVSACMIFTLVEAFLRVGFDADRKSSLLGGTAASLLTVAGGNGHYLIYGIIVPFIEKIMKKKLVQNENAYFFPDSTVFIGNFPETMDKGKHEFPAYTLVLGDLHAHAINLIFVILLIAILADYVLDKRDKKKIFYCDVRIYYLGILLGLFMGTNYWDFPIYFVVSGAVILFCDLLNKQRNTFVTAAQVLLKGVFIYLVGVVTVLPFLFNYKMQNSSICFTTNTSPIYKLVILWGIPVITCIILLFDILWRQKITPEKTFLLALIPCATGLVIVPEIIYVKDIYGEEYARFNTMFKLTYQAFVLFGICMGIALGLAVFKRRTARIVILSAISVLLITYSGVALYQYMGNIFRADNRNGCSAYATLTESKEEAAEAINRAVSIINSDNRERIHVMEKYGTSYTPNCRLSVFTGASDVTGWEVHEWLWRDSWDVVAEREKEIREFYSSGDRDYCKNIIEKYGIDYIFVGPDEVNNFEVNEDGFYEYCIWIPVSEDPSYVLYKVIK